MKMLPKNNDSRHPAHRYSDSVGSVVSAFESETLAVFARTAPTHQHLILYVLCLMLVFLIGLSAVVKLDRVVTGTGKLVPIGGQIYVSPLDRSIVKAVKAKAGDVVQKGQVLAILDSSFTASDFSQLDDKLASDQATLDRLQAEYDGTPYSPKGQSRAELVQHSIYLQRQSEYQSSLNDFDARIKNAESTASQYQHDQQEYGKRHELAQQQENMSTTLAKGGYVSKLQEMSSIDTRVELGRLLGSSKDMFAATQQTLASLKAQRTTYTQTWHSDLSTQLATAHDQLEQTRNSWQKAKKLNELQVLEAPEAAVVLKVGKLSSGSVADSNGSSASMDPLFTLVPLDAPIEAQINIEAQDIGFIHTGDPVQIKLDAYMFLRHGTAKGVVKSISEGSFTTLPDTNQVVPAYFSAIVTLTEVNLKNVPSTFRLVPGMTIQGDIIVGRRTILSYVVEGGLRTGSEAMREP